MEKQFSCKAYKKCGGCQLDVDYPQQLGYKSRLTRDALGRFCREKGVVSLPEMIRKMTAMPAAVYNLRSKGLVWEGFDADLCIFDPDKIIDRSEFTDCQKRAEGLNYVLMAGEVVVENAVHNGKRLGKIILREE